MTGLRRASGVLVLVGALLAVHVFMDVCVGTGGVSYPLLSQMTKSSHTMLCSVKWSDESIRIEKDC
jgi:hypothetical protein